MDAIHILNNYRASLSSDKDALRILSHLYRAGTLTENELALKSSTQRSDLSLKLNQLFRAQLACVVQQDKWTTTDLAEEILSRLGISEAVSRALITDQKIDEPERSFLEACIEKQSLQDPNRLRYQTEILRTVAALGKDLLKEFTKSKQRRAQLLYSAIVGLDSDAQNLGGAEYYKLVFDWHKNQKSDLWKVFNKSWINNENILARRCRNATQDVQLSNLLMVVDDLEERQRFYSKRTINLTLVRVLGSILSKFVDSGLSASFRANDNLSSDVWIFLEDEFPSINEKTYDLFISWGKADIDNSLNWRKNLQTKLAEILTKETSSTPSTGLDRLVTEDMRAKVAEVMGPMRGVWLENTLLILKSQVDEGHFDNIPVAQKKQLCKLIYESSKAFQERFGLKSKNAKSPKRKNA